MPAVEYIKTILIFVIIINIHKLCNGLPSRGHVLPSADNDTKYNQMPSNSQSNKTGFQSIVGNPQPVWPQQSSSSLQQHQRNMQPNVVSVPHSLIAQEPSDKNKRQGAPNNSSPSMEGITISKNTTTTSDYDDDDDDDDDETYTPRHHLRPIENCRCKIGNRCAKTDKC